ncbi:hypothetical protein [Sporolactobacillus terrae]|uniref:Uncharacterized protein n=1 Tax=Sporolactobacillus terrae TaxID=269673 RepID=A0A5K7WYP3_9BACL|nr:hypothetical protein [Sporolactobacillus terrae]BBN97463.1 hypothetical protein St703_01680 [Sporolactobacillus terrae]
MSIDVMCTEQSFNKPTLQALSEAGGRIHLPKDLTKSPSFRFDTAEQLHRFDELRKAYEKNAGQGALG